ncbi:MAG TPA: hypothetical protein VMW20_00590 [Candidatus Nanoarchaeia archaeon]|nr:hypothetical protein [Candidatus Nanoarchaeia archaeon]
MTSKSSIIFTSALLFLIFSFTFSTVSAFAGMGANDNVSTSSNSMGANPTYSYGTDIVMMQQLIEIDQVSYDDYIKVAETLVIWNAGTENYTGPIYAWMPDEAFEVNIALLEMVMSGQINLIEYSIQGNVVSWNGTVLAGPNMPPMYRLEYKVPKASTDTISVTKKLKYPTLVNYNYIPSPGMPALVIKVMKSEDMEISFTNGAGNKIEADSVEILEDSKTYNWALPLFEEITIKSEKPGVGSSDITLYLIIALIIIVIIGYSVLRGKSTAIKNFEEKLAAVIPQKQDDEIYLDKEDEEDVEDEDEHEDDEDEFEVADINDLNLDQLRSAKKSILNLLLELDEDYSSGNLSEEEYNRIRSDYKDKAIEILSQIDALEE